MKIDYISDLHADFHVKTNSDEKEYKQLTQQFASSLLPDGLGDVLIIAGDISHYNRQSLWILEFYTQTYEKVLFCLGNHDFYLINGEQSKKYRDNSWNRVNELIEMVKQSNYSEDIIYLLDFSPVEYKGVKFAGATNWYPLTEVKDSTFFYTISNDSQLIKKVHIGHLNYEQTEQYNKMSNVDVLVTHVPPIIINSHQKYGNTSCYLNYLKELKFKHVVFGHAHEENIYKQGSVYFYINALGYPNEWMKHMDTLDHSRESRVEFYEQWNKIKSFEV